MYKNIPWLYKLSFLIPIFLTGLKFNCTQRDFLCPWHWFLIEFNVIWNCLQKFVLVTLYIFAHNGLVTILTQHNQEKDKVFSLIEILQQTHHSRILTLIPHFYKKVLELAYIFTQWLSICICMGKKGTPCSCIPLTTFPKYFLCKFLFQIQCSMMQVRASSLYIWLVYSYTHLPSDFKV